MPGTLFRLYQRRRVINVNANVIAAGLLAIALAKFPVAWLSAAIGPGHKVLKSVAAYAIDMAFDVALYFALHWVANHWRPLRPLNENDPLHVPRSRRSFLLDAGRIQAERAALVPIFAAVAIGGMTVLQHRGVKASWAFVFAFLAAMLITRIIHTAFGLWSGSMTDDHLTPPPPTPPTPPANA